MSETTLITPRFFVGGSSSPLPPSPPPPAPAVSVAGLGVGDISVVSAGTGIVSPILVLEDPGGVDVLRLEPSSASPNTGSASATSPGEGSELSVSGAPTAPLVISDPSSSAVLSLVPVLESSGADSALPPVLSPVLSGAELSLAAEPDLSAAAAVSAATSALYSPNKTRSFPASLSFAILPSRTFNALLSLLSCASVASCVSLDLLLSSCKSLYLFFAALNAFLRSLNPNLAPKNVPARTASPAKLVAATPVIAPAASAPTRPTSPPVNTVPTAKTPIIPNTGPTIFLL